MAPVIPTLASRPGAAWRSSRRRSARLGLSSETSCRTRMFVTDASFQEAVGTAHAEAFASHPPATSMVVVAGLLDERWKVEIEAEADQGVQLSPDSAQALAGMRRSQPYVSELGIIFAVASALAANVAVLCKHRGATNAPTVRFTHPLRSAVALFRSKWWLIGFAVAAVAWGFHVLAMALAPLSMVQVVTAGGLALLALPAQTVLRHPPASQGVGRPLPERLRPRVAGHHRRGHARSTRRTRSRRSSPSRAPWSASAPCSFTADPAATTTCGAASCSASRPGS